jgi:endonuclease III
MPESENRPIRTASHSDGFRNGSRFFFFLRLYKKPVLSYDSLSSFTTAQGGIMLLPAPDARGIIRFNDGIIIDLSRARVVCLKAFEAYKGKIGIHSIIKHAFDAPQNRFIPRSVKRGSRRHILWLFFTALTDRREISENVYKAAAGLYEENAWIYGPGMGSSQKRIDRFLKQLIATAPPFEITVNPTQGLLFENTDISEILTDDLVTLVDTLFETDETVEEITIIGVDSQTTIESILRKKKVGSPGQSANYWPRVAETLYREFDGNPLEIFRHYPSVEAFLSFKKEWARKHGDDPFPGIGAKIYSLIAMFYTELGLITMPADAMPVDVHLQRFALETGIVRYEGTKRLTNEMLERQVRKLYCDICNENGWSNEDFSHAIWFLSKRLCSSCHRKKIAQTLCPTFDFCLGSVPSNSYFRKGIWIIEHRQKNGGALHR